MERPRQLDDSHPERDIDWDRPPTPEEQLELDRLAADSARQMCSGTKRVVWANGEVEDVYYEIIS